MGDSVPASELTAPSGVKIKVEMTPSGEPGIWKGAADAKEQGFYKVASGELSAVALSGSQNSREMAELTATAAKLSGLTDATGGGVFWTAARPGAPASEPQLPRVTMLSAAHVLHGSDWLGLKDRDAHIVTSIASIPLAAGLWALALLVGLMALAWWREGR